jgi:hypothetical protein
MFLSSESFGLLPTISNNALIAVNNPPLADI